MGLPVDASLVSWLSSPSCPPVRYLTAANIVTERPSGRVLDRLRAEALGWEPLRTILDLQLEDGSFPFHQRTPTAQPTFSAVALMARCGLIVDDRPVQRVIDYLSTRHLQKGVVSYTSGGSGVLPCYVGVVTSALIKMGALDTELVQSSINWLVDHQRFDNKSARAGGTETWPYRAPINFGCWETVSCYHGVAGAFRAFAAIPSGGRTPEVRERLDEAIGYLRARRLYKKTTVDRPLFRHLMQPFLVGDYRSDLLDMLGAVADADPELANEGWVADALSDLQDIAPDGRVTLVKNYGRKLIDPIPFETIGEPSRFLTYDWLLTRRKFQAVSGIQL